MLGCGSHHGSQKQPDAGACPVQVHAALRGLGAQSVSRAKERITVHDHRRTRRHASTRESNGGGRPDLQVIIIKGTSFGNRRGSHYHTVCHACQCLPSMLSWDVKNVAQRPGVLEVVRAACSCGAAADAQHGCREWQSAVGFRSGEDSPGGHVG